MGIQDGHNDLEKARKEITVLRADMQTKLDTASDAAREATKAGADTKADLEGCIATLKGRCDTLQRELDDANASVIQKDADIAALKDTHDSDMKKIHTDLEDARRAVIAVSQDSQLSAELSKVKSELSKAEDAVQRGKSTQSDLQSEIDRMDRADQQVKAELASKVRKIEDLEKKIGDQEKVLNELRPPPSTAGAGTMTNNTTLSPASGRGSSSPSAHPIPSMSTTSPAVGSKGLSDASVR